MFCIVSKSHEKDETATSCFCDYLHSNFSSENKFTLDSSTKNTALTNIF